MADVNQQVLDALNAGYGPEDILAHMHTLAQDSPAHAAWINNLQRQTLDVRSQQNAPDTMPDYTNPNDTRSSLELKKNALAIMVPAIFPLASNFSINKNGICVGKIKNKSI